MDTIMKTREMLKLATIAEDIARIESLRNAAEASVMGYNADIKHLKKTYKKINKKLCK